QMGDCPLGGAGGKQQSQQAKQDGEGHGVGADVRRGKVLEAARQYQRCQQPAAHKYRADLAGNWQLWGGVEQQIVECESEAGKNCQQIDPAWRRVENRGGAEQKKGTGEGQRKGQQAGRRECFLQKDPATQNAPHRQQIEQRHGANDIAVNQAAGERQIGEPADEGNHQQEYQLGAPGHPFAQQNGQQHQRETAIGQQNQGSTTEPAFCQILQRQPAQSPQAG